MDPDSAEGVKVKDLFDKEQKIKFKPASDLNQLRKVIEGKEKMLQNEPFKKIFQKYQHLKKARSGKQIRWYSFFGGPTDIRSLASHLKMESFYFLLYKKWSGSVHASDIRKGKVIQRDTKSVYIIQLRHSKDIQNVVSYCISFSIMTFNSFIKTRIPERLPTLKNWYTRQQPNFNIIHKGQLLVEK